MKIWKSVLFLLVFAAPLAAQPSFIQLQNWHRTLLQANNSPETVRILEDSLWAGVQEKLENEKDLPADSLPSISQIQLKAHGLVLYTWLTRNQNFFRCWGILHNKKSNAMQALLPSEAVPLSESGIAKKMLSGGKWPGMLTYEAVPFKRNGQSMYLLIGYFPGADNLNYKHLEVLSFDKAGSPLFGSRSMLWEGQRIGRKTFRYSAQTSMMLKTEKGEKRVVMDHLAPASPELKNQFSFYGPDLSYDVLEFNGEEWILLQDVDLKNPSQDLGQPGQVQRFGPNIKARRDSPNGNK